MNQSEIIAANRASAAEQVEQDERNEQTKAEIKADRLVNGHPPRRPLYFPEESPRETRDKELQSIVGQNIEASQ